jgi:hypothetical protein
MRAIVVRAAPLALFAALAEWTAIDVVRFAPPATWALGGIVLGLAGVAAVQGSRTSRAPWHRASRALLALAFVGERILAAGVDVVPMIGFLVLLIALASLHSLERTFGPVYDAVADPASRAKVDSAAVRAYARALGLLAFTFVASLLLALMVPLVAIPTRSLAAAFGLAVAVLVVIAWLALSPALPARRRG